MTATTGESRRHRPTTNQPRSAERGEHMTTHVLDRDAATIEGTVVVPTLGDLHDEAQKVDETLLPCRVNNPELWFAESPADVEFAKVLCQACPVREMCLGGALERREPWGVWGGELFLQGTVIARKRPRGRPRKDALPL